MEWAEEHNETIRRVYPERGGLNRLCEMWPDRTRGAIAQQAHRLGVRQRKACGAPVTLDELFKKAQRNDATGCIEWQWVRRYGYGLVRV